MLPIFTGFPTTKRDSKSLPSTMYKASGNATADGSGLITVTGLLFTPYAVVIQGYRYVSSNFYVRSIGYISGSGVGLDSVLTYYTYPAGGPVGTVYGQVLTGSNKMILTSNGFSCGGFESGTTYQWAAR
jgi:hypothetical protein